MEYIDLEIPGEEEENYIDDMLSEYNQGIMGFDQNETYIKISRCIKSKDGSVIGGILAYSVMWHILYIDTMWINESYRKKGYGSILLNAVLDEGRKMGCHIAHLETFDFQGSDFYLKNGFEIFGVLEDSPKGHKEYFMKKIL